MASDTASIKTQTRDDATLISPTDTQGSRRFESITHDDDEYHRARSETLRRSRPSAISTSPENYGTFLVNYTLIGIVHG